MLWLSRIDRTGLQHALELKPEECDDLQGDVESAKSSWAWTLKNMLGHGSTFDFETDIPLEMKTLDDLSVGDFLYISGSSGANGHALAVYKHQTGIMFFNPGEGLFYISSHNGAEKEALLKAIKEEGSKTTLRKGMLRSTGYLMPRFYGG